MAAEKTIRDYSCPKANKIPVGPNQPTETESFELKPRLINMVPADPLCGKASEDANAHLQQFMEVCYTYTTRGVTQDAIRIRLFPFSLMGKAKQWFYNTRDAHNTWEKCANAFLNKYFPPGKTNTLRSKISNIQQVHDEMVPESWDHFQEYLSACPHHRMEDWFLIQRFYHGLQRSAREHLDAAAGGPFFSLSVREAKALIEKIAANQG